MDDDQFLDDLLECLDRGTREADFGWANRLVKVEHVVGDEYDLGLLELDDHPGAYLMGFTAPASWRVIGVMSGGFAGPLAGPGEEQVRPSAHPDAVRVRVIALAARNGSQVSRMCRPDGTAQDLGPGEGFVPDLLSRALGLPTPPPPVPPQHLAVVRWLEDALAGRGIDLPEQLPPGTGWDFYQQRLVAGDTTWNDEYFLRPDDAAWMDTGMLARWLLAEHPPLDALLDHLDQVVGPEAAAWARLIAHRNLG